MQPDPHRLLVLRAVRRTGSIQAAAAALHLTASGVSQHLSRLETETQLRLLDRSQRGGGRTVRLTTAGLAMADRADAVATALAEAQREADQLRDGSQGTVRIGGFGIALGQLVVPVLAQLAISEPALQIQIFEVTTDDGLRRLRASQLDLLIDDHPVDAAAAFPGLIQQDLGRDDLRIVVPQIWPTPPTLEQLLVGPWVTSPPGEPPHDILDRLCAQYDVTLGRQHACTESRTMLTLVAAGLGAAILPELTLSRTPTSGIRIYPTDVDIGSRKLTLLSSDQTSPATHRVRTLLLQLASGQP